MNSLAGRALRARREHAPPHAARSEGMPCHVHSPILLVSIAVLAFWPVWRWYVARLHDGSDEPLGLLALIVFAIFLPRRGWREPLRTAALVAALVCTLAYIVAFDRLPPLVRAGLAVTTLACLLPADRSRARLPLFALLLLSLPVIATLQYYCGYPLRAATTWCCAHLLTFIGHVTHSHGTVLTWAGEDILVDAPCSGIRMLWTAVFLSTSLAAVRAIDGWRFVRLLQFTATVVFLANLARTFVLFFLETGLWPNPPWAHQTAGLLTFAFAASVCIASATQAGAGGSRPSETARP